MRKRSVCTLCYQPYSHRTGVERYALGVTEGLRRIGIDVEVVCADQPRERDYRVDFMKTGIGVIDNILFSLFAMPKLLRSDYDVIHVHGFLSSVFPAIFKKIGLLRKPLVYSSQGLAYFHLIDKDLWLFNHLHYLEKLIFWNADGIINGNKSDISKIARYARIPESKIRYIYAGGVDPIFKPIDRRVARRTLGIKPDEKMVLFVGTFGYRKGTDLLVDAVSGLEGVHLYLIGRSTPYAERLLSKNTVPRAGHVHLNVPEGLLPVWYSAADVFVLPSRHESFGLVILEAMACGTPTISSNIPQIREAFGDATYPVRLTVEELRAGIGKVLGDEPVRKALMTRGRKLAQANSWESKAKEIARYYDELH